MRLIRSLSIARYGPDPEDKGKPEEFYKKLTEKILKQNWIETD
jgi:hypothetical protein